APATYIPIPPHVRHTIAGLVTIELPQGVRIGETFTVDFRQFTRAPNRFNGAFRVSIHVEDDPALLHTATRELALLKYRAARRPGVDRWSPVLAHWIDGLTAKVRGLGGDPDKVPASLVDPTGTGAEDQPDNCGHPAHPHGCGCAQMHHGPRRLTGWV